MPKSLLIANRGEIAVRIARTAADLGVATVAVYAEDDAASLHTRAGRPGGRPRGGRGAGLSRRGGIIAVAQAGRVRRGPSGLRLPQRERRLRRGLRGRPGLTFVGPSPETLELFGDKAAARALAERCGVPVLAGISRAVTLEEARAFLAGLGAGGAVMLKAVAGGGGRGMRPVTSLADLDEAFERCGSEAAGGLRLGRALRRGAAAPGPARRGADRRATAPARSPTCGTASAACSASARS